jgi:recombination associated protein RdgC
MIKNATTFTIPPDITVIDFQAILNGMNANTFSPCGASQEKSCGWIAPRQQNGALLEAIGGQWVAKLAIEIKSVPASVIQTKLTQKCKDIEEATGRKPGKKERREMKDEIRLDLLPLAFPKLSHTLVWIDPGKRRVVIDTPSSGRSDEVVTQLIRAADGLALQHALNACQSIMIKWLQDGDADGHFNLGRSCELKATDESKAVVQYKNIAVDADDIRDRMQTGLIPTKLALHWGGEIDFTLTGSGVLRGIDMTGVLAEVEGDVDAFDADVLIATSKLSMLLDDLIGVVNA